MRRADDEQMSELDDADRDLVRRLRALPPDGGEPDWNALERSIRDACGPDAPRPARSARRLWRWLVPIGALAVATAALLLWLHRGGDATTPSVAPTVALSPPVAAQPEASPPTAVWLGGRVVDLEDVDPAMLLEDELDEDARDVLATEDGAGISNGVLPAGDLGWVEGLDDSSLERAEHWLEGAHRKPT